jgi:hypothetical protein
MHIKRMGMNFGYFRNPYISKKMNSQRNTIIPGVFSSTIYHIIKENTLEA